MIITIMVRLFFNILLKYLLLRQVYMSTEKSVNGGADIILDLKGG